MENKNTPYIRKPKIAEQIDPLLAREYEKLAADKARSLINRPDHEVSIAPEHRLVSISDPDSHKEFVTYDDLVVDPSHQLGAKMSGTTEEFIGDGKNAVIQNNDMKEIEDLENEASEQAYSQAFIDALPEGKALEPIDMNEFRERLWSKRPINTTNNDNDDGPEAA